MEEHKSRMLYLGGETPVGIDPVQLSGEMTETEFERFLVHDPAVLGEDLFLLGRQLSEFQEDSKRLDLLAVDKAGELVLIELKVDGGADFTELQAIGYAGAYSTANTEDLVKSLVAALTASPESAKWLPTPESIAIANEESVKEAIVEFLEDDAFEEWSPSQKVRIKIVGPGFPRRVVASIRWLLEIHNLEIEAIEVKPFRNPDGTLSLIFERLLPLPGDEQLGLTRRKNAEEQQSKNESKSKNKSVLPLLIQNGDLVPGDVIVLTRKFVWPKELRDDWDPQNVLFQGVIDAESPKKVLWRPTLDDEPILISPARMANLIQDHVSGEEATPWAHAVANGFTKGPDGPFLDEIALDRGLWFE